MGWWRVPSAGSSRARSTAPRCPDPGPEDAVRTMRPPPPRRPPPGIDGRTGSTVSAAGRRPEASEHGCVPRDFGKHDGRRRRRESRVPDSIRRAEAEAGPGVHRRCGGCPGDSSGGRHPSLAEPVAGLVRTCHSACPARHLGLRALWHRGHTRGPQATKALFRMSGSA
jgi:hypothetical protein